MKENNEGKNELGFGYVHYQIDKRAEVHFGLVKTAIMKLIQI